MSEKKAALSWVRPFALLGGSRGKEIKPFLALSPQTSSWKQAKAGPGSPVSGASQADLVTPWSQLLLRWPHSVPSLLLAFPTHAFPSLETRSKHHPSCPGDVLPILQAQVRFFWADEIPQICTCCWVFFVCFGLGFFNLFRKYWHILSLVFYMWFCWHCVYFFYF